ncbi:MAG: mannose-1-phosphate guanylyltransferase [Candidatus Mesenet longicola]|uniref:Mannose-1-phosphate guanylyltransferase n=1 Tax=Candidatus Mesenet longicola TaxID=1892558 RepID=A0A8J3MMN1_9RICK|nr:MAG: mannose-1-phosphate guanylyltransferase [Candidatus Mesenet longicola]GHM60109.1 MAG: mannose-1-phosphate guanylyltransferase [Candidatus Mesenet longicola]
MPIQSVLLCGGVGSRLWPISQPPKQFCKVFSDNTMLHNTLSRLHKSYNPPIITTNITYESLIIKELDSVCLQKPTVILEPAQIGTAASILLAIADCCDDTIIVVLPTDHYIENKVDFQKCLEQAITIAKSNDAVVIIGKKPNYPSSEFGYIKAVYNDTISCYSVNKFIEKPLNIPSEEYFWNLGIFIFKAKYYFSEVTKLAPNVYKTCIESRKNSTTQNNLVYLKDEDFMQIHPVSFDYMIMQKTKKALMIEATFDWIDVGTWNGILSIVERLIKNHFSSSVLYYMKDVVSDNIAVKEKVVKPWGFYSVIAKRENFLIKYLHINPARATSMQLHKHRDEYYVILSGTACITLNTKIHTINQSAVIEISRLSIHRIENKSNDNALQIIEIQIGNYISENDIIRLFDNYGRV